MLSDILRAFATTQPLDYVIMFLGIFIGFIVGFLPGIGASQTMALLIPLTYGMPPLRAILLLMAVAGSAPAGGSIASILLNAPGEAANVATCWDGYPMARQGKAGMALGAASTASFGGALVGLVVLIAILPLGKMVVLSFSYPEIFTIAFGGLICLILVEEERLWKGFISLALGMVLVCIGYDSVTGGVRLTFGSMYLWEGIKVIPALVGLFAVSEGIRLVAEDRGAVAVLEKIVARYGDVFQGVKSIFTHFRLFVQSSIIGAIIGIAPGVGGAVGNVLSYSIAVQTTKDNPHFGKGDIRGVIASEAANNSKGGDLVPTVLFGIPGSVTCALLLGALMLHGIKPGPRLIIENPGIIYGLIIAVFVSSIVACGAIVSAAPYLSSIPNIPDGILGTVIIILGVLGGYATELDFNDAIVAVVFGLLGYFFSEFGYSKVALVMALVLGGLFQDNFFLTIDAMGPQGFFVRPISLIIILLCIFLMIRAIVRVKKGPRKKTPIPLNMPVQEPETPAFTATSPSRERDVGALIFSGFLVIVALIFLIYSFHLSFRSWIFPGVFSIALLVMTSVQTWIDLDLMRVISKHPDVTLAQAAAASESKYPRLGLVIASVVAFYLIFRILTIYLAIPVLSLLFLRFLCKRSWTTTFLAAVSLAVFVYVFFQLGLQTSL